MNSMMTEIGKAAAMEAVCSALRPPASSSTPAPKPSPRPQTMPISWRGTLAQYVGRLHRLHPAKREVLVCDHVDEFVPVLQRMMQKRVRAYRNLGYSVEQPRGTSAP